MISAIIPVKDRSKKLARALENIDASGVDCVEIVIVNDNSSADETEEIEKLAGRFANVKLLHNETSHGAAYSRNLAVERSSGNIIAFLDSDDWWAAGRLAIHAQALSNGAILSHNRAALVRGGASRSWVIMDRIPALVDRLKSRLPDGTILAVVRVFASSVQHLKKWVVSTSICPVAKTGICGCVWPKSANFLISLSRLRIRTLARMSE